MNDSKSEDSKRHIDEFCLAYVENVLSPEEQTSLAQHVDRCASCAKQTEDMSRWVTFIKNNKHALCPEEWELFDYVREARDDTGVLASHLEACEDCRARAAEFRQEMPCNGVPGHLWQRMTHGEVSPNDTRGETGPTWQDRLRDVFAQVFGPRLALAGAVAAAILLVVFLYPSAPPGPFLGLSTLSWGPDGSDMTLMGEAPTGSESGEKRFRLAAVVYFKDFLHKPEADRIDAVYRLLDPGKDIRARYDMVSPLQVKEAVHNAGVKDGKEEEVLRVLRDKLAVNRVLIMTLSEQRDRFSIQARLVDAATGRMIREHAMGDVTSSSLCEDVETAFQSALH